MNTCLYGAILNLLAPKCFVEFLLKALMLFEVIQIYWKLIVKQFQPLRVVPNFNDERVECIAVNGKAF